MSDDSGDGDDFITIHGETFAIDERKRGEAEKLVRAIHSKYRVELSSDDVFDLYEKHFNRETEENAARQRNEEGYRKLRRSQLGNLGTSDWTLEELTALDRALERYGKLVARPGKRDKRVLFKIGKLNEDPENDSNPALVSRQEKILAIFDAVSTYSEPPYDTLLHEIAHAAIEHRLPDFVRKIPYWAGWEDPSDQGDDDEGNDGDWAEKNVGAEAPPTERGKDAPYEDFAECMMLYLYHPVTAKKKPKLDKLKRARSTIRR